jgi:predicted MFS family arabinose efflux permease
MFQFLHKKRASFHLPQFPRPFWFLTAGSFLNRAGNFVMPFFVLYLTSQRGLSISQATLIISLMGAGSLGASFIGGMLADTLGRRKTILASLLISGGLMFALGCIRAIPLLIVCALCLQFFNQLARRLGYWASRRRVGSADLLLPALRRRLAHDTAIQCDRLAGCARNVASASKRTSGTA